MQWPGVICHQGRLADQRMAQLAGELGEVCPGKSSQQKTDWAGAGQQGWCARQAGSQEHGGSRQHPTQEPK